MLFEIRDGTVSRGGEPVLTHFDFWIRGTEKIAIVGRNGAGKTTLLAAIAGEQETEPDPHNPASGIFRSRNFTVGELRQQAVQNPDLTVEEFVRGTFVLQFDRLFTGAGFRMEDRSKRLGEFSGGEQTRICLIRLLLEQPDVLLLDEPTNHLDFAAAEWLEDCVRNYPKAVVLVSHDRFFIDQTADAVWEISRGRLTRYAGGYTDYREEKTRQLARAQKAWEARQAEEQRLNDLIKKFRGKPRKAAFARSREKLLERMGQMEKPEPEEAVIHTGDILPARPGSKWVFGCEDLVIGYRKDRPVRKLSFRIRRGQKIGIIGPNGSGKTTFLRTVAGQLKPLHGKAALGENVDAAYFDQMTAQFTSEKSVLEWFHDRFSVLTMGDARAILAGYLFRGEDCGKPVSGLSGGEKSRLMLAALLESRPNFLILDEPTNNMDIPAKETLESIFRDYRGTILFVSHDRYFLSQVAEALLIFEPGTEEVRYYPNDYRHYRERQQRVKEGLDADLARSAEEQRLIEGLRSVPKAERGMLRQIPEAEQEFDWRFELNRPVREAAEAAYAEACGAAEMAAEEAEGRNVSEERTEKEEIWADSECGVKACDFDSLFEDYRRRQQEAEEIKERTEKAWTAALLDWYDIWQDREEYRKGR